MKPSPWTAAFDAASLAQQDTIPKDFKSVLEIAREIGLSDGHTRKILKVLVTNGGAEMKCFRVQGKQNLRMIPFYRLKPKK